MASANGVDAGAVVTTAAAPAWRLPADSAALDRPPASVERVIVVAATPRSGSTLLCEAMAETGVLGVPREYLAAEAMAAFAQRLGVPSPTWIGHVARARRRVRGTEHWRATRFIRRWSFLRYLEAVAALRTTPGGVFSIKIQSLHLGYLRRLRVTPFVWGPSPEVILVTRDDETAQAVSLARARRDGAYRYWEPRRAAVISTRDIDRARADLRSGRRAWEQALDEWGLEPIRVRYEDLDREYETTTRAVFGSLGFGDLAVPPPRLERQRDTVSAELVAREAARATRG